MSVSRQSYVVAFDDRPDAITVVIKSRDLATLERDGVKFDGDLPVTSTYTYVLTALRRMRRTGDIDFDPPATVEQFMDVADVEVAEDGDAEGEGSGQVATPGKPQS